MKSWKRVYITKRPGCGGDFLRGRADKAPNRLLPSGVAVSTTATVAVEFSLAAGSLSKVMKC